VKVKPEPGFVFFSVFVFPPGDNPATQKRFAGPELEIYIAA